MHPNDKKQKFIELRVKGESLGSIAKTLDVPRTTLWHWHKEEEERINELQLMEQDESESIWLAEREERLSDYQMNTMTIHRVLVEKIETKAEHLPIKDLFLYLNLLRSEMEHYRIKPLQRDKNQANRKLLPADEPAPSQESHATIIPLPKPNAETVQNGTTSPENGTAPRVETKCTTPNVGNSHTPQPTSETKTEQNGTTGGQNGTASNPLPNPVLTEEFKPAIAPPLPCSPNALSGARCLSTINSQPSTNVEMVQNGTNPGKNGTAPAASPNSTPRRPEPIGPALEAQSSETIPKENQLPAKPTPPPERMIGHKIDPTKIIGRNTPLP